MFTFMRQAAEGVPLSWQTFLGEDANGSPTNPLTSTPNSENAFLNWQNIYSPATQDFESYPHNEPSPLTFALNPPGGPVTVTITDPSGPGKVFNQAAGTSVNGRHSIPSATSSKYWESSALTNATGMLIAFSVPLRAVGFYLTDVGDFSGVAVAEIQDASGAIIATFTISTLTSGQDGSVMFWGIRGNNGSSIIHKVRIRGSVASGDVIGLDRLSILISL